MNGPAVVQYLRDRHGLRDRVLDPTLDRLVRAWAAGDLELTEPDLDRLCVAIDLHLDEIPAYVLAGFDSPVGLDGLVYRRDALYREEAIV